MSRFAITALCGLKGWVVLSAKSDEAEEDVHIKTGTMRLKNDKAELVRG